MLNRQWKFCWIVCFEPISLINLARLIYFAQCYTFYSFFTSVLSFCAPSYVLTFLFTALYFPYNYDAIIAIFEFLLAGVYSPPSGVYIYCKVDSFLRILLLVSDTVYKLECFFQCAPQCVTLLGGTLQETLVRKFWLQQEASRRLSWTIRLIWAKY